MLTTELTTFRYRPRRAEKPTERRQSRPAEQPVLVPSSSSGVLPGHLSPADLRDEQRPHRVDESPVVASPHTE